MITMTEEVLSFENDKKQKLVGIRHIPKGKSPFPTVILYPGLTGGKAEGYRKYVRLSRLFAHSGFQVFRFDFRGHGDSFGNFEDFVMDDIVKDSKEIFEFIRDHKDVNRKRIAVVSRSLCPGLYIRLTSRDIKAMVLHCPAAYPKAVIERGYGVGIKYGRRAKGGFILNEKFWENLDNYNAFTSVKYADVPIIFISGDEDSTIRIDEVEELYKRANSPKKLVTIKYADHTFWRREHEEKVNKATLDWIKKYI